MADRQTQTPQIGLPQGGSMDLSLAEVFRQSALFLRRHIRSILILALIFAGIAGVASQMMEKLYRSSVQMMIEQPPNSPIETDITTTTQLRGNTAYVDGQILLIQGDDMLRRVVEDANLAAEPHFRSDAPSVLGQITGAIKSLFGGSERIWPEGAPSPEVLDAMEHLRDALSAHRQGDTNVVRIDVLADSPALARRVVTAVAEAYVDTRLLQREEDARAISVWIDQRAAELRAQVEQAEQAVTDFRVANGLIGQTQDGTLNDQQVSELNAELIRSRSDLAQKRAALQRAQLLIETGGDIQSLPEVQSSELLNELRQTLVELEIRARDLSGTSNPGPRLTQLRDQIEALQEQVDAETRRIVAVLENEVDTLERRNVLLREALDTAGGESAVDIQNSVDLRQLERVAEAYRLRYERYLNSEEIAAELSSFASTGTRVLSAASVPIDPVWPPVRVFLILGFLFGGGVGAVIGLAREALDTSLRTSDQIERLLGLRVLAHLPQLPKSQEIPDIVSAEPLSLFSETISALRYSLAKKHTERDAPVLLVTSTGEYEGKTSIAASIAEAGSVADKNVLLIDGDLRRSEMSAKYDLMGEIGLSDILQGARWQVPVLKGKGTLDVLPAGVLNDMPLSALDTQRLPDLLAKVRKAYDLVVIDGPPVTNVSDCAILSQYSDQVLYIVRWGRTLREQALRAINRLPREKMVGVVVNCSEAHDEIGMGETYRLHSQDSARSRSDPYAKVAFIKDWGRRA